MAFPWKDPVGTCAAKNYEALVSREPCLTELLLTAKVARLGDLLAVRHRQQLPVGQQLRDILPT